MFTSTLPSFSCPLPTLPIEQLEFSPSELQRRINPHLTIPCNAGPKIAMANPELCAAQVISSAALEETASRTVARCTPCWTPRHPAFSEILHSFTLFGTQDERCGLGTAGHELESAACRRARGVRRSREEDQGDIQSRAPRVRAVLPHAHAMPGIAHRTPHGPGTGRTRRGNSHKVARGVDHARGCAS